MAISTLNLRALARESDRAAIPRALRQLRDELAALNPSATFSTFDPLVLSSVGDRRAVPRALRRLQQEAQVAGITTTPINTRTLSRSGGDRMLLANALQVLRNEIAAGGGTPAVIPTANLVFDMDPSNAASMSLVGTGIDTMTFGGITMTAPSATRRLNLNTTNLYNGKPCIDLSGSSPFPGLRSLTGGPTGNANHSIFALVEFTAAPVTFGVVGLYGKFSDAVSGATSVLGVASGAAWGGGFNQTPPQTPLTTPVVAILSKVHEAGTSKIGIDGQTLVTNPLTFVLSGGLGIEFATGVIGVANCRLVRQLWYSDAKGPAEANQVVRAFVQNYALTKTAGETLVIGDSRVNGFTNTNPATDSPAIQLAAQLAALHPGSVTAGVNFGVNGTTTTAMLALAQNQGALRFSARRRHSIWLQSGFINDVSGGATAAQIIANMIAISNLRKSLGAEIKLVLTTDPPRQGNPANQVITDVNAFVLGQAVAQGHADAVINMGSTLYGDLSSATFHPTDITHYNTAGSTIMAKLFADGLFPFAA